ncbi:MAG: transporter substrate-binding domain-containing protein, partial [Marinobacter sp.]|nr:transporter substrate-binding domain-containing protein [Marinobacter sp.]
HRLSIWMLLGLLLAGPAWSGESSEDTDRTVNYLVVDQKTVPFQIVEHGENRGGIVSDIVAAIFQGTGYRVVTRVLPVNRLRLSVLEGKVHHWVAFDSPAWNSLSDKGEMLPEPLFTTHHIMLTCNPDVPDHIDSINDLKGLSVVTLRHFNYLSLDRAETQGLIRSVPVDRFDVGLKLVSLGRADGFIEMKSRLQFHRQRLEDDASCLREVDVSRVIPDYEIRLSIDRAWPDEFKNLVAKRLEILAGSGTLKRIRERYVSGD